MKIAVCAIAKLENNYIREWVEHYKNIGFDNILLYDNNDDNDDEKFEDVINDYILNGFVILHNKRNQTIDQAGIYNEAYKQYSNKYDYIAFFDIDEFLHIDEAFNIKDILLELDSKGFNMIRVNWKVFTDSYLIQVENNNYSRNRFHEWTDINSETVKSIIKTNIPDLKITVHGCELSDNVICGDVFGNFINHDKSNVWSLRGIWNKAYLDHYQYRTIDEWIINKIYRKVATGKILSKETLWGFFYGGINTINWDKLNFAYKKLSKMINEGKLTKDVFSIQPVLYDLEDKKWKFKDNLELYSEVIDSLNYWYKRFCEKYKNKVM